MVTISRANADEVGLIAPLFDAYRVFYGQPSNLRAAESFLSERFNNGENIVFLARHNGEPIGFVQLYNTFSSVSMQPFLILNDLFVKEDFSYENTRFHKK